MINHSLLKKEADLRYYKSDYKTKAKKDFELEFVQGSGGGGCFPAGTQVRTTGGSRAINRIKIGEPVVAYDRFGELSEGRVIGTNCHKAGTYSDELYYLYNGENPLFNEGITGNHAVLDCSSNEHKQIKEFKVGEYLTKVDGTTIEITSIVTVENPNVDVFNLIIEPQHTYIVGMQSDGIRVHNGGGGKDGGGEAREAVESENTIQSLAVAKVLEVYSHGEVEGIVGGAKGTTFNNTQVQNTDDSYNFEGITFEERVGLPNQTGIPGFEETEAELAIAATTITASGVVQDLPDSNVDAARVTIRLNEGLWQQSKSNGDLLGYTVGYKIQIKEFPSGSWSTVLNKTLDDKTTSPWEISHRISKPAGVTQWSIKVIRTTPEDSATNLKSVISWVRLTEIYYGLETYNNIALVGITIPAKATGNRIPNRAYQVKGIKVRIPSNYDPLLRTYGSSYWNGTFKTAWTDSTPWILFDLITNPEYGMTEFLGQELDVDIFAFYEAALYCDATSWDGSSYTQNLLDDGQGGFEVRYRFNGVINTQQDAWQLLHAVASNMRAVLVNSGDQISIIQDRPKVATKIINNSNVIEGLFVYSGTEVTSRATSINCTFNDKNDRFLPRTITEEDTNAILKYGHTIKDIVAYGSTSESQSRRMASWALYTELNQYDLVSFSLALNIIDLSVGDVVAIMDTEYISDNNQYLTGRVLSVVGNTVTLGNEVELLSGYAYTLGVMSIGYDIIEEVSISNTNEKTSILTTTTTLPEGDYLDHEFFCFSSGNANQSPREFMIQSISESDRGVYSIAGIFYDSNKFAAVEQGIEVPDQIYSNLIATVIPAVTNIQFEEFFTNTGIVLENYIDVTWSWNNIEIDQNGNTIDRLRETTFTVKWRRDNNKYSVINDIPTMSYQIPSTIPGVYEIIVEAQNIQGKRSTSTFSSYNYRIISAESTLIPPENFYVSGTFADEFTGTHIPMTWTFPSSNETKTDILLKYLIEVWAADGLGSVLSTYEVTPNSSKGGSFEYTLQMNLTDFSNIARRDIRFKLYSRDTVGDVSTPIIKNFVNPVPAAPAFSVFSGSESAYIDITPPSDLDVVGYIVWRSETSGFTPQETDIVYDDVSSYTTIKGDPEVPSYYYRVAAYDTFGKTNLNLATEQSSSILGGTVPVWIFTELIFKPNDPATDRVSWTAGTASLDGATPIVINANSSVTPWSSGIQYFYYSGSGNEISVTSDIAQAISGAMVLATYKGGTSLIVGNGDAFTDGGLILANTVGANQLVADSAIITNVLQVGSTVINEAAIVDAVISNAKIKDYIQSLDYDELTNDGWKIDKYGNIVSYGSLTIMDGLGNVILTTGDNAAIEWGKVINQTGFAAISTLTDANVSTYVANGAFGNAQIDRASINKLVVVNGDIGDLQVSTLKIEDNAVTIPLTAYTVAGVFIGSSYVQLQSVTISSPGIPIQILFGGFMEGGQLIGLQTYIHWGWLCTIELRRNNVPIVTSAVGTRLGLLTYVDTPAAGTYTYTLHAKRTYTNTSWSTSYVIGQRTINILGIKK